MVDLAAFVSFTVDLLRKECAGRREAREYRYIGARQPPRFSIRWRRGHI
jgi:hypothetical protein